jgi:hypothetical protein
MDESSAQPQVMRISGFDYSGYFVDGYDPGDAVNTVIFFFLPRKKELSADSKL